MCLPSPLTWQDITVGSGDRQAQKIRPIIPPLAGDFVHAGIVVKTRAGDFSASGGILVTRTALRFGNSPAKRDPGDNSRTNEIFIKGLGVNLYIND
jgi:hypothetical protein